MRPFLSLLLGFLIAGCLWKPVYAETLPEEALLQEVQYLRGLKESNPERYREIISQKKQSLHQNLSRLKEKNPEEIQRWMERQSRVKKRHLEYFKNRHPDEFDQYSENRQRFWEQKARANPERFQHFMESHPELRKPWEEQKKSRRANTPSFSKRQNNSEKPFFREDSEKRRSLQKGGGTTNIRPLRSRDNFEEKEPHRKGPESQSPDPGPSRLSKNKERTAQARKGGF